MVAFIIIMYFLKKMKVQELYIPQSQFGEALLRWLGLHGLVFFNAPEVAILGVCRSARRPVWDEKRGEFVPRLILPLSLSWDHRVIDGAAAARFNAYLAQLLGDFRRILL